MIFTLDDFLPYQLSVVSRDLEQSFSHIYEGAHGLSRTQWRVMAVLAAASQFGASTTAQTLARKTGMDKATISRSVKRLITRGFVLRSASQSDGRYAPLSLTVKGQDVFDDIMPSILEAEAAFKGKFDPEDLAALGRIVKILGRHGADVMK